MTEHICTICNKPVIFGEQPHHGRTLNHYACEAPRMDMLKELTHDDAIARGNAAIAKMDKLIKDLEAEHAEIRQRRRLPPAPLRRR